VVTDGAIKFDYFGVYVHTSNLSLFSPFVFDFSSFYP